jgi:serine/threonine protein kinase
VRWADHQRSKAAKDRRGADKVPDTAVPSGRTCVAKMRSDESDIDATQPYTDPRRLGLHGSGMTDYDAANVICILHPTSPAAQDAVAATIGQNPNHIIPNADLLADDDESLFDPAARIQPSSREIALRISSPVKNSEMGFVFGRNPEKSDVLLTKDSGDDGVSNRHFRIYFNKDGVLMLQDTSTNGTLLDEKHLKWKQKRGTDEGSHMLQSGMFICVVCKNGKEIKFLVRVPNRGDRQDAYNANLEKHVRGLPGPKSKLVLGAVENSYGMYWNGGSIYNVIGCLGKGAFATVYKLATKKDGHVYAAKELNKSRFRITGSIPDVKFDNEIQIMKDLRHPNIVQYEDYHTHGDYAYIIMEIVTGGELSTLMHKRGPVPEPMVQTITRQILHALAYLHARGITHRDIKPDNILISETDPLHVKLSDFGLSKCITNQETFLKTFCGTLLYCAPEIYPGYGEYDKSGMRKRHRTGGSPPKRYSDRVDMWSFGAVLFHVLCNRPAVMCEKDDNTANRMLAKIMTEDINFFPLYHVDVSEEAVDFISNLLKRNPVLRPTPKACFEHAWIAEVADLMDYMNLDDEMPAYRGQGLAPVEEGDQEADQEADQNLLTRSDEAAYGQIFGQAEGLTAGYPNVAGERVSKRQRLTPGAKTTAITQPPTEVTYPKLPDVSGPTGPLAADTRGERLFGEITASALRSSGVFGAATAPVTLPALQNGVEQISVNDFATFETNEPLPSTGEASDQPLQYPRALDIPGALPSSAPSLFGAEAQIGQLNMASPEAGHSEGTTPDTGNPMTPETRELTPAPMPLTESDVTSSSEAAASRVLEEPVFSRYIDLKIPPSLAHDTEFVKEFNARQAEAKERRARKAKARAQTFSAAQCSLQEVRELAKTVDARVGKGLDSQSNSTQGAAQQFSRRVDLPPLDSLYPTSTTTADGFTKPPRRFGKLTTLPGSYTDVTIYINSRLTSWGRGMACNAPYDDKTDIRIPHYAIQITYHAPDMDARVERGQPWETSPGIHTVVSTKASTCIWVNDVELRSESSEEQCTFYGKIYTGDIITVYQSPDPKGSFLKFRVEMNYGDSARRRPANEIGFQVMKETVHHKRELKRRESLKSNS